MAMKVTPGTQGSIVSDGHVVLMPAGLTGSVEVEGVTYDLGDAQNLAIEVESHEHAKEAALLISQLAHESADLPDVTHDEATSRKALGLPKKKG
jgi:hypothetical protein